MISAFQSRGPFQPFINGYDLTGSGDNSFPLPGDGYNQYGISKGASDLRAAVDKYNSTIAGTPTPRDPSRTFPHITLPSSFDFGMPFNSQDFRLTKNIHFGERLTLRLCAEVFNAFNIANLGGYSNDLTNPAFGQPTTRASNIFGSGGPRAFQFGGRLIF
jgi:hypothetical protein